ncbi:hypothetical protein KL86APRO_10473 [uncultured Alphaproteobacteria bacterium]|uniref:Phage tail collar domain-containing protein n=1 Tax=uncultured Alphaproteobacteria bacterium TaxID=91750 RepID=A0A212J3U4_9PROT|nr:hypothetical protein KL86APRO_10473 [uncultured Alphaproteobacteria bacterium]
MADNLIIPPTHDKPAWPEAIKLIDTDEPVQGGLDGVDNLQAQQLAARSQWLKAQVDAVIAWAELTPDAAELDQLKRAIAAKLDAAAARPATTTASGVVELATNAEAQAGTDAARAVTPAALAACTATESRAGMVELATVAEAKTGTDGARAVTPAGLAAALASLDTAGTMPVAAKSAAYIATANDITKVIEATANSWSLSFAPAADLGDGWWCAVRNAGTGTITLNPADAEPIDGVGKAALPPGASCFVVCDGARFRTIGLTSGGRTPGDIFWTSSAAPPSGSLKANGAAVSRTEYAALFAAIGVTYGAGDEISTFNLPDLRGEFVRGWDDGRDIDAGRALGSAQLDAFQGHWHYSSTGNNTINGGHYHVGRTLNSSEITDNVRGAVSDGENGTPRTAAETRPRNVALLACIQY